MAGAGTRRSSPTKQTPCAWRRNVVEVTQPHQPDGRVGLKKCYFLPFFLQILEKSCSRVEKFFVLRFGERKRAAAGYEMKYRDLPGWRPHPVNWPVSLNFRFVCIIFFFAAKITLFLLQVALSPFLPGGSGRLWCHSGNYREGVKRWNERFHWTTVGVY